MKNAAAYLLLTLVEGSDGEAVRVLEDQPGVVRLDSLEGEPGLVVLFEAEDRTTLATYVSRALGKLDDVTSDLNLLFGRVEPHKGHKGKECPSRERSYHGT
jgi:hypothetical protein